jgi:anti-sigma regulatory factor (Ser/Thr protein kinase)/anti-anti-sigma regulatory factor
MERIPILKMGPFLLVPIQVDMHDRLAMSLQDDITSHLVKHGSKGVLIDISSLDMVDSFIGRMIANIGAMSRILGAETVVVGMQPSVAITLVELGLSLPGVHTALNVERGMEFLKKILGTEGDDENPEDVVRVRKATRIAAVESGLSLVDQTKLVTAASELARNTMIYGGGGTVLLESIELDARKGVRLMFEDRGPGIVDLELALKDGYTTGGGLGLGLSGAKRLCNEFELDSRPGEGTRVTIVRWKG